MLESLKKDDVQTRGSERANNQSKRRSLEGRQAVSTRQGGTRAPTTSVPRQYTTSTHTHTHSKRSSSGCGCTPRQTGQSNLRGTMAEWDAMGGDGWMDGWVLLAVCTALCTVHIVHNSIRADAGAAAAAASERFCVAPSPRQGAPRCRCCGQCTSTVLVLCWGKLGMMGALEGVPNGW